MRTSSSSSGLAMVAVLLVLMALFVLSAPFLVTVRNADQASAESADRSVQRLTLDAAARHAKAVLSSSHPALDPTPYFDDEQELRVENRFPEGFLATDDPSQVMWDLETEDVSARVDLASASPHVFANLIGGAARLTKKCTDKDTALELSDTEGLLPEGVVMVDDEIIGYAEIDGTKLGKLTRALLVKLDDEGKALDCGPSKANPHEVGAYVIDQRAWALCEWRIASAGPRGEIRAYEGIEQLREAKDFVLAPELGRAAYLALERTASCYGRVRAGARWQHGVRVVADPSGLPQYGCELPVDDLRWFNPGTTVWITDGTNSEYALVRYAHRSGPGAPESGKLTLTEPLRAPFKAHETVVRPLARTPVNVNTAAPEVLAALWTNLKLKGKSARITEGEAEQLVEVAVASRPFTGFEDFLRRFVLPAAGLDELPRDAPVRPELLEKLAGEAKLDSKGEKALVGFIDADDARALYKNCVNANDNELEFATMPIAFTSRDVYELDLRVSVNAPSGVERARGLRELTELVVPQRDLLTLWTRQEDFDDGPRLDLGACCWLTGPVPTSRPDPLFGEIASLRWPARAHAHLGPHDTVPSIDPLEEKTLVYSFPVREDEDGWAQLAPYREQDVARKASYAMHFDDESKNLEGRFLPDGPAELDLAKLGWTGAGNLMGAMAASLWIQPRELQEGARLLDVAGEYSDSDRLSLLFEKGNLVLRVLDGAGDHPTSEFEERAEIHYPLSGEGPGLPTDTWSHVQIAVDGSRPDQMAMWIDGRQAEHSPGLTRLTSALSGQGDRIGVESTEGFPEKCVLRIGQELIEAFKDGDKGFRAKFQPTGVDAGFGGRIARELYSGFPEINDGLDKAIDHPAGSSVQLYGYSLPLSSNVPNVASSLTGALGMFAVARIEGIVINGSEKRQSAMPPITPEGWSVPAGNGFDGLEDNLEGLLLLPVDPNRSIEDTMAAFNPDGGYAAILGGWNGDWENNEVAHDINQTRMGGIEVVRYTGWDGQTLKLRDRGAAGLAKVNANKECAGRASFLIYYAPQPPGVSNWPSDWADHNNQLSYQTMVIPISVPVRGTSGVTGFEVLADGSSFAQITRSGGESHLTEWVRYDELGADGSLVRDDPQALNDAQNAAHLTISVAPTPPTRTGMVAPAMALEPAPTRTLRAPAAPTSRSSAAPQQKGGTYWDYVMGVPEDEDFPVARSVNSWFQFRGVLGTYQHEHSAGTMVLPVFRARNFDETAGWPGRFDHVMFLSSEPSEPGFPGLVHHAHRPWQYLEYDWIENGMEAKAVEQPRTAAQSGFRTSETHVALDDRLEVPFAASRWVDEDANPVDTRLIARMVLFPSGEMPREVRRGQLGGDAYKAGSAQSSRQGGVVPAATVDEALFFPNFQPPLSGMPIQLVVATAFGENDKTLLAMKETVRVPYGDITLDDPEKTDPTATEKKKKKPTATYLKIDPIAKLPPHGGLLRIGDELLGYDSVDRAANTFTFTIPPAGRGLLGTEVQPHRPTEGITFVGSQPLGVLAANIDADDALIPLLELPPGFPTHGTVRIEDELVHYSRVDGGILAMPRASAEPGEMDEKGPGLFRGRYGTERASHESGTPVILFPFRYWDRWTDLADAPELSYYGLSCDQPDAYWKRVFWKATPAGYPGPRLGVLQRTDEHTPWDSPADGVNGLDLLWEGKVDAEGNEIGVQSDRVEWRVFVRHEPGSFDAVQGLAHGWKTTPRLELFGVEYMGPGRTLARIDR